MTSEYPLNCFTRLTNDAFSGWYAVSNKLKCNDFCAWQIPSGVEEPFRYTADPHQVTKVTLNGITSTWGCFMNAASDETTLTSALHTFKPFAGENISTTFNHLRCNRGAGEVIQSIAQIESNSLVFWRILLILCFGIIGLEVRHLCLKYLSRSTNIPTMINEERTTTTQRFMQRMRRSLQYNMITSLPPNIMRRRLLLLLLITIMNLGLLFVIFFSTVASTELSSNTDLSFKLKQLTPACTNPSKKCEAGNRDIDKPSLGFNKSSEENFQPFSYLIASDVQLNWYAGESASIGTLDIPPSCSVHDSCGHCTNKQALYTNKQMKTSLEKLISSRPDGVFPKTLVMNGDLTAYFHRHELSSYIALYHNITGLEEYFPSLGNHDYSHQGGASFDDDQWFGPHHCNEMHSIGYLKSAFCDGNVPHFQKDKITRYDSKSLSYSWEEGPYHFVHLHFYPTFESAAIGISSSVQWLTNDLTLAHQKKLTSVLFIHAADDIPPVLEDLFLQNNVAIIFAGHLHRCLGRKCAFVEALSEEDVNKIVGNATYVSDESLAEQNIHQCFPARSGLCGSNAEYSALSLFFLKDANRNLTITDKNKLFSRLPHQDKPLCPKPHATFINTTDNTLLCTGFEIGNEIPSSKTRQSNNNKTIPIVWSGSASFETFLIADFKRDRIVVDVMTAQKGFEGKRYIDSHDVPSSVYPLHHRSDVETITVFR